MTRQKAVIVVPCFNEAKRLPVATFRRFMGMNRHIRFIFVDDGSTDGTLSVLRELAADSPDRALALHLKRNAGKAEAVRQGMLRAVEYGPDIVGFWDADLATPLEAVPELLAVFAKRPMVEWIFGARVQLLGRNIRRRSMRHYSGRIFATLASLTLGLAVYDTQCGAKLFRCDNLLKAVIREKFRTRWIFDVELIARMRKTFRDVFAPQEVIFEYPLTEWIDIEGSKVKALDFLRAFGDLLKIWIYLLKR